MNIHRYLCCPLMFVLPVLLFFSAFTHAKVLPFDDFIKQGDYLDAILSPDGKHLAVLVREKGVVAALFFETKTLKPVGGIKSYKKDSIHTLTWANNERVLFEYAKKHWSLDGPSGTGELFAVNIDGSKRELIFGFRARDRRKASHIVTKESTAASHEIISLLENDKKHILIIEYPWSQRGFVLRDLRDKHSVISKLNIYSGRKRKVEVLPYKGAQVIADEVGNIPFMTWVDKDSNFHAAYRKNKHEPWKRLDKLLSEDKLFVPITVNKDQTKAYLLGDAGHQRLRTLYKLDLKTQALTPLFNNLSANIEDWFASAENDIAVGFSYPDTYQYHYLGDEHFLVRLHKKAASAFKGQEVFFTSGSRDGTKFILHVRSDVNPGEYYLFDLVTNQARLLLKNRTWLDRRTLAQTQPVILKARDGLPLVGYLTLPAQAPKPPPLIVIPHGGPHWVREYWHFDNETQLFASQGYAVLKVNFRGGGGFGRRFEEMGYRQWGGAMIDDIIDATRSVAKDGKINARRVCIYGASYGGYSALMSAVKAPDLYRCVIGAMGVYDLSLMYEKGDIPDIWGGEGYLEKVIGRDPKALFNNSPVNFAKAIQSPVLLLHGEQDERTPPIQTEKMRDALRQAGKSVKHVYFDDAAHGTWSLENKRKEYTAILEFLNEHVGR